MSTWMRVKMIAIRLATYKLNACDHSTDATYFYLILACIHQHRWYPMRVSVHLDPSNEILVDSVIKKTRKKKFQIISQLSINFFEIIWSLTQKKLIRLFIFENKNSIIKKPMVYY